MVTWAALKNRDIQWSNRRMQRALLLYHRYSFFGLKVSVRGIEPLEVTSLCTGCKSKNFYYYYYYYQFDRVLRMFARFLTQEEVICLKEKLRNRNYYFLKIGLRCIDQERRESRIQNRTAWKRNFASLPNLKRWKKKKWYRALFLRKGFEESFIAVLILT